MLLAAFHCFWAEISRLSLDKSNDLEAFGGFSLLSGDKTTGDGVRRAQSKVQWTLLPPN